MKVHNFVLGGSQKLGILIGEVLANEIQERLYGWGMPGETVLRFVFGLEIPREPLKYLGEVNPFALSIHAKLG